jgi:hypothetical protein
MANLQLLLNSALILIITTFLSNTQSDIDLRKKNFYHSANKTNLFPLHYDIELTLLDLENTSNNYFNIFGKCNITFHISNPIMSFEINLAPSINILTSNLVMKNDSNITFNWTNKRYSNKLSSYQEWIFKQKLEIATYIVMLEYNDIAHNNEKRFFRTSYKRHNLHTGSNDTQ